MKSHKCSGCNNPMERKSVPIADRRGGRTVFWRCMVCGRVEEIGRMPPKQRRES